MATIDLKKIRKTSGSYYRITGNKEISNLMTAIQAAAISNGNQVAERFRLSYTGNLPLFYGKEVNSIVKIKDYFEKIFVISHNPMINQFADTIVKIKKEDNISKVLQ